MPGSATQEVDVLAHQQYDCAEAKRKASPEVLKEVGPLMKLYQEEVDKLSNR